jgi:hypothetical protein
LDESKGALGWLVTWLNSRSIWVAGGLVDSNEHWGGPVAWLN